MKYLFSVLIMMFLLTSCFHRTVYNSDNLESNMQIVNIVYFNVNSNFFNVKTDSITAATLCVYKVNFINATIIGENNFSFIDSIGKYNIGDKFPKIK